MPNPRSERKCPRCETLFVPNNGKQVFCCRRCFKGTYDRSHLKSRKPKPQLMFRCPYCRATNRVDFDPKVKKLEWYHYGCPACGRQPNHVRTKPTP